MNNETTFSTASKWGMGIAHGVLLYVSVLAFIVIQIVIHFGILDDSRNRTVTLYDSNGAVVKTWSGRFEVASKSDGIVLTGKDGKEIRIHGTYSVEDK